MGVACDFCLLAEKSSVEKNREQQLELWDHINWDNKKYKKYDAVEQSFAKQFEIFEQMLGLFDVEKNMLYWTGVVDNNAGDVYVSDVLCKKSSIYYYWGMVLMRMRNIVQLKNYNKMNELTEHFYEKLISYYGYELFSKEEADAWQEKFSEWKNYDKGKLRNPFLNETHNQEFARRVEDLSYYLHQLDLTRPAAILMILSIYIGITEEPDSEFLRKVYPEQEGSVQSLTKEIKDRLKQYVEPKFRPITCDRIEKLMEWFPEDEDLQELRDSLEKFRDEYQEVEFK